MKISGNIFENMYGVRTCEDRHFLFDNYTINELDGEKLKIVFRSLESFCVTVLQEGIWVSDDELTTKFIDVFIKGGKYPVIDYEICSDIYNVNDFFIFINSDDEEIVLINISNWELKKIEFDDLRNISFDDKFIYARLDGYKKIVCFDFNLEKQWEYADLKGRIYLNFERKPQLHNDLVIINHAYDTVALSNKTGEEVWKYTFEDIPTSNVLMEGKIYAVCKAILYIINPETGEVALEQDTGFPVNKFNKSDERNRIGIFPVGDYLYGVAQYDDNGEWLRLYNYDASKVLDKKTIPDYWLNPYGSILPTIHNGKIYQQVRNRYAYSTSGILVIDIVDEQNAAITIAPRPPATMQALPSISEPHKLQIFLDADDLDDALRYGDLLTNELLFTVGYYPIYNIRENALDTLHNGKVELIIDDTGFDEDDVGKYLSKLESQIKESIKNGNCVAGDKKTAIQFTLLTQPKAEWDKSGEQLDWPAIRQQETPLI